MITTDKLFELIDEYIFALPSKKEIIKHIFNNDIKSFTTMNQDEIEKKVNRNLLRYFKKQFESNKLPNIIEKYIKTKKSKELSKEDMSFLDNIIIETEYEVTYEDLETLLNIKEINDYLSSTTKDTIELVEKLRQFIEIQDEEEKEDNTTTEEYDGTDIEKLYERDCKRYNLLTYEEERYYLKKYQEEKDFDAYDILVGSNQGLCKKIARKYEGRGLSKLDLIQEGNIGLIKSLDNFNLKRETKLSTYAVWWIDQAARKALRDKGKTIRIPVHVQEEQNKLRMVENKYIAEHGTEPTIEELSELSGFTFDKIQELRKNELKMVSFDKKVSQEDDDGSTLGDFIKSDIETPEEIIDKNAEKELIEGYLQRLANDSNEKDGARKAQIIRLRYGIELYNVETYEIIRRSGFEVKDKYILEDVGKMFGVTRERIRQLEGKAIITLGRYGVPYMRELLSDGKTEVQEEPKEKTPVKKKRKYTRRNKKEDE